MNHFAIFAKYWQPGAVKTRLAKVIGAPMASDLSRWFLEVLLSRFETAGDRRVLVYSPIDRKAEFETIIGTSWSLEPQNGNDLGERLKNFFDCTFARGAEQVIVIGSDSPTLPKEYVEQAWQELQQETDVVLGPTEDGGYYLVGARQRTPPIFDSIEWSTERVWQQTIEQLQHHKVRFAQLPMWYDVDEVSDLNRLLNEIQGLMRDRYDEFEQLIKGHPFKSYDLPKRLRPDSWERWRRRH